jgi:hypothetical protein
MGEGRRAFMTLVGKTEEKRQLGSTRCRQNYNIKIGHKKRDGLNFSEEL